MEAEKIAVILLTDLIARKDDHILGIIAFNKGYILINCIGCTLVPVRSGGFLIGRKHMNSAVKAIQIPGLSISDIFIQYQRLILGQDTYCVNS